MQNGRGRCSGCKFFDPYYTKGVKKFNRTKYGMCFKQSATAEIHQNCDKFECRPRGKRRERLLKYYLSDLLTEISEIRKVIEADIDEREMQEL